MNINKSIFSALLCLGAMVGFSACSSDDYEATPAVGNGEVYFSKDVDYSYNLQNGQSSIEVEIYRVHTEGDLTVNIEATDTAGFYSVAKTATFAAGQNSTKVPVTFLFDRIVPDNDYALKMTIANETSSYGDASKEVVIKYAPWTDWEPFGWEFGTGVTDFADFSSKYTAFAAAEDYDGMDELAKKKEYCTYTYTQYVGGTYSQFAFYRESALNPAQAQFMLFDWLYGVDLIVNWNKETGVISVDQQFTGDVNSSYGKVYVADSYTYFHDLRGQDCTREQYLSSYDKNNGKVTLNLTYFVSAGYFGAGEEYLQLPGFEKADYSLDMADLGAVSSDLITAETFHFSFGEDVGTVKYQAFPGEFTTEEIQNFADGIFDGSIPSTTTSEQGYKTVSVADYGIYTLVAVIYDKAGGRAGMEYTVFNVEPQKTWAAVGTGTYIYTLFFGSEDEPAADQGLVLYQCDQDPTKFKIENWGNGVNFTFNVDAEGNIVVDDQYVGYDEPSYGPVYVIEANQYSSDFADYSSEFEDNSYYFCVAYYVEEGYFGVGYEQFALDEAGAKAIKNAKAAAKFGKSSGTSAKKKIVKRVRHLRKQNKSLIK